MQLIVHVNRFVMQANRERKENNPVYCIHDDREGFPYYGRFHEVRVEGNFAFMPGLPQPLPETDTPAGATHVVFLDEGTVLRVDDGRAWRTIEPGVNAVFGTVPQQQQIGADKFDHDEWHIHQKGGRQETHKHNHPHSTLAPFDHVTGATNSDHLHGPQQERELWNQ